jgi:hypothetical protein
MTLPKTLGGDGGDFLSPKDLVKQETIVTIHEEPRVVPSNFKNKDGSTQQRCRTTILLPNKKVKIWTMNNTTFKKLAEKFGQDEADWVGKKVKLIKTKSMVNEKLTDVVYGEPA